MTAETSSQDPGSIVPAASHSADRFRERARSVATMLATTAGALAAGLVFSPAGQDFSPQAQVAGYCALILLIASGCCYIAASLYYKEKGTGDKSAFAREVIKGISRRTKYGSYIGIIGLLLTLTMIPLNFYATESKTGVLVHLKDSATRFPECPKISDVIDGRVTTDSLYRESGVLEIEVDESTCGQAAINTPTFFYIGWQEIDYTLVRH